MFKEKNWAGFILFLGLVLFAISFFLPVTSRVNSEGYYYGYDAIQLAIGFDRQEEGRFMFALMYLFVNFSNISVVLMLFILMSKTARRFYLVVPILGFISALIWLFDDPSLLSGYWLWLFSQLLISIVFISNYAFIRARSHR